MLYWLAKQLAVYHTAFNVFSYLTLRGILAVISALLLSLLVGPGMIRSLSRGQIGQVVRDDGPQSHLPKARHADDGRRADHRRDRDRDAAVGGPDQPLRLDHPGA